MGYKVIYIEDLDPDTRIETLQRKYFSIKAIKPSDSVDTIVNEISDFSPDLILLDYILTEGSNLKYCNAPTIAATLRSLTAIQNSKERPIILMSTQDKIVDLYAKDYTSHDLFDYAITKSKATKESPDSFVNKCISFIEAYEIIRKSAFDVEQILAVDKSYLHSKLFTYLNEDNKSSYQYCRFIFEHVIRCSGLLIGEDIMSARLGVSKKSKDWDKLLSIFSDFKYRGILHTVYDRWWMKMIDEWWFAKIDQKYSLRHYNAEKRVEKLANCLGLNLSIAETSEKNASHNFWTICVETKLPLDPFDGIELLEEEFKPWQDKDYLSIDGYLMDISKYSKIVSPVDRNMLRENYR